MMLSESIKQTSDTDDVLSNSQGSIQEIHELHDLKKMTGTLSLSSSNKVLLGRILLIRENIINNIYL